MSYDDDGYTPLTEQEIIKEKEDLFSSIFGIMNNTPSDILWQWQKLSVYERKEIEALHAIAAEMMSIQTARGAFLDKFGVECGIERKGETKSEGYVEVTRDINGVAFTLPSGTKFKSASNYYSMDDEDEIPYSMVMTKNKTGESDDYFSVDIDSVESIEKILDEKGNEISEEYYSLDSVYKNNVQWTEDSSDVLVENNQYTVYVSGEVVKRVEVSSDDTGVDTVASIGTVTTCVSFPSLSCNNASAIEGGTDEETDDHYRTRLLQARRRTFTIPNIRSIILGIEGVRSAKVYQDVGTDQSSVADWDNPILGGTLNLTGTTAKYSQAFVPGDQIATLGRITLHGRPYNDPPAIYLGIKRDVVAHELTDYFDYISVERYEIDQTATGMRDIIFNVKYNGMDKTKTYRFDIWCDDPEQDSFDWSSNYWILDTTIEGYRDDLASSRGMLYEMSGGSWLEKGTGMDLMFKTSFNGAGFTSVVATEDGYGFENIEESIETLLDYIDGEGYAPVCIQSTIVEADEVLIDVKGVVWITALADFQEVRRAIVTRLEDYLESLTMGDNVVYSKVFCAISECTFVTNLKEVYIKRSTSDEWVQNDIGILDSEIPDLGSRSFQRG